MKTVMDEARTVYFRGKINVKFQQFADDYGFRLHPCLAARPRTNAKVEASMKILDENEEYKISAAAQEVYQDPLIIDQRDEIFADLLVCHLSCTQ